MASREERTRNGGLGDSWTGHLQLPYHDRQKRPDHRRLLRSGELPRLSLDPTATAIVDLNEMAAEGSGHRLIFASWIKEVGDVVGQAVETKTGRSARVSRYTDSRRLNGYRDECAKCGSFAFSARSPACTTNGATRRMPYISMASLRCGVSLRIARLPQTTTSRL